MTPGQPPARREPVERRAWFGLVLASSTSMVVSLAVTAMNLAFPSIERDFAGTSRSTLSWGITGYSITLASLVLVGGRIADRRGRRLIFRTGIGVFIVASVLIALAPNAWCFLAARIGQAVGAALSSPASLTLVLPMFPASRRMTAIATWTSLGTLGSALGPSLAAVVTQQLSWRWIFVIPLAASAAAFVLAPRLLPEGRPEGDPPGPIDAIGVAQGTVGVACVAFAITEAPRLGWSHALVLAAALGAVVLLPWFFRRSLRHPEPLLDLHMFRARTVWSANLGNVFLSASGVSIWLVYPLFLVQHWHYSLLRTGLAMTPQPAAAAAAGFLAGRLAERYGVRRVIGVGSLLPLFGTAWLVLRLGPEPQYVRDFLPGALAYSIGFGLIYSPLTGAALRGVSAANLGQANAAFNALRQLAGGLGIAIVIAILGDADQIPLASFDHAYLAIATMTLLGWIVMATCYPRHADALVMSPPTLPATSGQASTLASS